MLTQLSLNFIKNTVPDTAFFYVGHQQFHTNPPVTSTQCMYIQYLSHTQSQYTSYAPQYATHKPECAVTPETAHSGTYIHTNPEHGGLQQQLTQVHTNPSVEDSSNSSLRHIYTHKPKCGGLQQQLTQVHINR